MNNDMYPELSFELETDTDCNLIAYDKTDYDSLDIKVFEHHGFCEFITEIDVNGDESEPIFVNIRLFMDEGDPALKQSLPYKVDHDGCYVYRRLVLPNEEDDSGAYIAADRDGVYRVWEKETPESEPTEITDYMALYDSAHDRFQEIFIGEKLGLVTCKLQKCLFAAQKASIDDILKKGCDFTCSTGVDNYKRDFLLSAMLVIDYYTQSGEIKKAVQLLNRLHACGGICGDNDKIASDCGCGGK